MNNNGNRNENENHTPIKKNQFSNKKLGNMKNVFILASNSIKKDQGQPTTEKKNKNSNTKDSGIKDSNLKNSNLKEKDIRSSISFKDFGNKSASTITEEDLVLDYLNEISSLVDNLKLTRKDSLHNYINDFNISFYNAEFYKKQKKKKEYQNEGKNNLEARIALDYLNLDNIISENDLICVFYNLVSILYQN